jgi:hypothetical protein
MKHCGNGTLDVPSGAFKFCLKRLRLESFEDEFRANHSRIGMSVSTDEWNFMKVISSSSKGDGYKTYLAQAA